MGEISVYIEEDSLFNDLNTVNEMRSIGFLLVSEEKSLQPAALQVIEDGFIPVTSCIIKDKNEFIIPIIRYKDGVFLA